MPLKLLLQGSRYPVRPTCARVHACAPSTCRRATWRAAVAPHFRSSPPSHCPSTPWPASSSRIRTPARRGPSCARTRRPSACGRAATCTSTLARGSRASCECPHSRLRCWPRRPRFAGAWCGRMRVRARAGACAPRPLPAGASLRGKGSRSFQLLYCPSFLFTGRSCSWPFRSL